MKKTVKKKKSLFDRVVAWLHLWPSIVSGIIVVFVCLTGTLIVYCDEIMDWTAGDAKYVELGEKRISTEELASALKAYNPDLKASEYVFFKDPKRSIRIRTFNPSQKKLFQVYMDPYTGKVLKCDSSIYFFFVTAHLHSELLAGDVGLWIVVISTIIFFISCLTGLILWWPKRWTKATRLASFTVRWKARFKRLNYDLHNVYGFYSLALCVILSFTGLMIMFDSLTDFSVKSLGGELTHLEEVLPQADSSKTAVDLVALAYATFDGQAAEKASASIWVYNLGKTGAYVFNTGKAGLKSVENMDLLAYDRYTGAALEIPQGNVIHEKTENVVWQLHMGQWWGQFGKLSTFLAGIIATSLPITGFIIWWGRRKKKPAKAKSKAKVAVGRKLSVTE
ncbi:PepSY domain-containing protein [Marinilongibacter aquaticus]|uniref:PepSY-associated TM helix domain-containing protein n=1 Tax=Marinilongibacter aquaticus TaxID=2975157 RepID=UPI0021BD3051|nr:PepSY-associated TM helix domain-containing protein [Marinilongibacter aquaticus]UBM58634.1 PepSY domain-containing protein [Marinilongibacter aquaticus]